MAVIPLLLGMGALALGLAVVTDYRGFRQRVLASRVNLRPGGAGIQMMFQVIGACVVGLGALVTLFGVMYFFLS
ncbi:hypothetical protein HHL19_34205 [Streptomyces sp. R302]|uniref:hypothetical protein n=1 Tax=unclassified Streptomyces TaxID=2593676 RepID=UPI00145F7BFD|nr:MULTISPECIES: hypothetical protein [unclassified Streptomyces]NML54877.1 hypothetical protein [Streptomyces sp. R301]NML83564.1 hypothetical protein [Streptomyces sp. R302]